MITSIKVIKTGYAKQRPFFTMKGGSFGVHEYPIYCTVLEHSIYGKVLIDCGYGKDFLSRLSPLPRRIYGRIFMDKEPQPETGNLESELFQWFLLSHFHPDHLGGVSQINYQKCLCSKELKNMQKKSRLGQLRKGFFSELLADTATDFNYFEDTQRVLLESVGFKGLTGYDVFDDKSIYAIPMSGHAQGQYIFYLQTVQGPVLFGVDVAWHSESIREGRMPSLLTKLIVNDYSQMKKDIGHLARFKDEHPEIPILLSHCEGSLKELLDWDTQKGGALVAYQENESICEDLPRP